MKTPHLFQQGKASCKNAKRRKRGKQFWVIPEL